jgi:hypothetical protein
MRTNHQPEPPHLVFGRTFALSGVRQPSGTGSTAHCQALVSSRIAHVGEPYRPAVCLIALAGPGPAELCEIRVCALDIKKRLLPGCPCRRVPHVVSSPELVAPWSPSITSSIIASSAMHRCDCCTPARPGPARRGVRTSPALAIALHRCRSGVRPRGAM